MAIVYYRTCKIEGDLATALQQFKDALGDAITAAEPAIEDLRALMQDVDDTTVEDDDPLFLASNLGFMLDNSPTTWIVPDPGYTFNLDSLLLVNDLFTIYNGINNTFDQMPGPQIISEDFTGWRVVKTPTKNKVFQAVWVETLTNNGELDTTFAGFTPGGSDIVNSNASAFRTSDIGKKLTITTANPTSIQGTYIIYQVDSAVQVRVQRIVNANPPTVPAPIAEAVVFAASTPPHITSMTLTNDRIYTIGNSEKDVWLIETDPDTALPDFSDFSNGNGVFTEYRRLRQGVLTTASTLVSNASGTNANTLDKIADGTDLARTSSGSDKHYWEQRLEEFGTYVVNGKFIPAGLVDLTGFRRLVSLIGCDTTLIETLLKDKFVVVMTYFGSSVFTDNDCKPIPITTTTIEETVIGTNISVASAADIAGIHPADVKIRFFWSQEISLDAATIRKITNLGISAANLTDIVTLTPTSVVESYLITPRTLIADMKSGLTLNINDICELAKRTTGPIALARPGIDDLKRNLEDTINQSPSPKEGGGDAETPGGILFATLDVVTSLGVIPAFETAFTDATTGGVGTDSDVDNGSGTPIGNNTTTGTGVNSPNNEKCLALLAAFDAAVNAVQTVMGMVQGALGGLSLDTSAASNMLAGLFPGLLNCVAPTLPSASLSISLGLGEFGFTAMLTKMAAMVEAKIAASEAINAAFCGIEGLVNAVVGGVCGLSVGNLDQLCLPAVVEAFKRLQGVVGLVRTMMGAFFSSLNKSEASVSKAFSLSFGPFPALTCGAASAANNLVKIALPG